MFRRGLRLLAYLTAALLTVVVISLLVLHSNPVQSRLLDRSIRELEKRFSLDLSASDLHFNLAARRVTLRDVRLAAVGHRENPFFAAESVTVTLPWAAYTGRLRFDRVDIENGRVSVVRNAQGVSNLPPGRGSRPPDAPARRIDIRGVRIDRLDFDYRDLQRDQHIYTPGIRTDLTWQGDTASGLFAIDQTGLVRVRTRRVEIKPLVGQMAFDGSGIELAGLRLDTTDGLFDLSGRIDRALDRPTLDLHFLGETELSQSTRWAPPPVFVGGRARVDARMTGAPSQFVLDAEVTVPSAQVGEERGVSIAAQSQLTPNRVTVSQASIRPATGGEITATVDAPFGADTHWWIKAAYDGVDAASAFRLAEVRPLPFGAALSGNALIERRPGEAFRLEVRNTSTARPSDGTAPLAGVVTFVIDGNRWRAEQQHQMGVTRVNGTIGGLWNRQAASQSTFEGSLDVRTQDVGEAARYAALFGFATPEIVRDTRGPLQADLRMSGVFVAPRFTGSIASDALVVPTFGTTAITADIDASRQLLSARNIQATFATTVVRDGEVVADLATRELRGEIRAASGDVASLLAALPPAIRLQGSLDTVTRFSGTVDAPDIVTVVEGRSLSLAGQPIAALTGEVRVRDGGIDFSGLRVQQPDGGELRSTGRYEWAGGGYTLELEGSNLRWRGTLARLGDADVRFALKFAGAGTVDRPEGEGAIQFAVSGGTAGELIDRGDAFIRLNGETAVITARIPTLGAFITANVLPRAPFSYDAVAVMNRIDVAPLLTLAGVAPGHVTGTASLSASAAGELTALLQSRVFLNLQELNGAVAGIPVALRSPSRLAWQDARLSVDNLDVSVGQGQLLAAGSLGRGGLDTARWQATFKGELSELLQMGGPFGIPAALSGAGTTTLEWRSTGGLDQSTARLHLEGGSVGWAALPAVSNLALDATFDGSTLNLTQFTGTWQGGGIEGTASIPRAVLVGQATGGARLPATQPGFARLRVSGLTEAALAPWLSETTLAAISGRLSATLDTRITHAALDGIAGTLIVDEATATIAGVNVSQARASVFEIAGGLVTARDVAFNAGGSPLTLSGTALLTPRDKQALALTLRGNADLRLLSAFTPAIATDGEASINIGIGGTPNLPLLSGRIDVAAVEVAIREPRIVISDLSGIIALDGRRVLFDGFRGQANGGGLTLDGGFLLTGFTPTAGSLAIILERAALEYPAGLQSEANAIVSLNPGENGWTLVGDVTVERSAYARNISIAGLIASRSSRPPSTGRNDDSWLDQLRLNLWVTTLQDLVVDNNYGRFEVGGALRVGGTVGEPVLGGRLVMAEGGEVYLLGNTFDIARGSITFTSPFRIVPEFDIELRTLVGGTDLTLTLEGPIDRLRTDVRSSNPSIDSREAISMLFGGLQGEDAITLLSAELLGATGRAIGLDALRVERGFDLDEFRADPGLIFSETDPATRLTLSKRLRPDVELVLSQSLRESGGLTAIVNYRPRRNIELRVVSRDNIDRSVGLRHEITFGGAGGLASGAPTPAPTISAVTISGDPGRTTDELLTRLDLQVGDRFDFHRWQRDIDRLRAAYQDEQRYEVRVRSTRRNSDDGLSLSLDYVVEPGPLTELVVEGHPLERELQEEIVETWRRTIFDRFLLEEIRTRVERHLLGENIVGSTVAAEVVEATAERKRIRVAVAPGQAVTARTLSYEGNRGFAAERLDQVIEAAGLRVDGWLDPTRVAVAAEEFYRAEGYLEAKVDVAAIEIDAGTAQLPVRIVEGPRFTISTVTFPGVSPERLAEVRAAAGLEVKTPFVTSEMDAARERIEELYAADGFNTVQIEVDPRPDAAAGAVAVSFAVLEGVQQVLREVSVQGADRTQEDVVRRALRLRVGEPVNLADWSQARKRVYDTNVFRQVDVEPVPLEPTTEQSAAGIQPVRASVRVVEYPVWRLRYGSQFTDAAREVPDPDGDTRLQTLGVLADLQNQNLFGRAVTAGIAGRYERNRQAGSLFTSNSSFFGLPIRSSGFLFYSRQRFFLNEVATVDERVGMTAEQRWRPFRSGEVLWSYRFERNRTSLPDFPTIELPDPVSVSRVNAAMYFDRRDDPTDPTRGWFTAGNFEQALTALGSDSGSGKLLVQHAMYRGIGRMVAAGRVQFGSGYGDELVLSERFLLGGSTTVRGYASNSLGPVAAGGLPAGGDALLALNGELRVPVRGWVQGVVFADAGNVFATRGELSFRDLLVGYGIGLRLASPFAMLRIDFGVPAATRGDRPGNRFSSGRWYFGVGHIF